MKTHSIVNFLVIIFTFIASNLMTQNIGFASVHKMQGSSLGNFTFMDKIEEDLLDSAWFDSSRLFIFNRTGFVTVLAEDNKKVDYLSWDLQLINNEAYLTLSQATGKVERFRLVRANNHLQWIDMLNGTPLKIDAMPIPNLERWETTKSNLVGTWCSNIYPAEVIEDMETNNHETKTISSATFKYEFLPDGRFVKTIYINAQERKVQAIGVWELAFDATSLIIHLEEGNAKYKSYCLEIKHLSFDELVLDQAAATSKLEDQICANSKTFYFNKH
ncbi:MAG: hypothetical protein HC892_02155 [Saprospiraceae bacterium]|nr:hypothetical protein [Saprospiraceae bacterium]